jgi:hypothetical protein
MMMFTFSQFLKIVFFVLVLGLSSRSFAADETITFKVNGTAACELQIETLITSIDGVVSAEWDATTQIMTVVFNAETIKKDRFYIVLAEGGYDNQGLHAKKGNYEALAEACKYTREIEKD